MADAQEPIPIINPPYDPNQYLVATDRADGGACKCGTWMFYSSTCGGVYQMFPNKCGVTLTRQGHNTAYCKGTSQRVLIARAYVNRNCAAAHPHPWPGHQQ